MIVFFLFLIGHRARVRYYFKTFGSRSSIAYPVKKAPEKSDGDCKDNQSERRGVRPDNRPNINLRRAAGQEHLATSYAARCSSGSSTTAIWLIRKCTAFDDLGM